MDELGTPLRQELPGMARDVAVPGEQAIHRVVLALFVQRLDVHFASASAFADDVDDLELEHASRAGTPPTRRPEITL